jgi:hypothetical protein
MKLILFLFVSLSFAISNEERMLNIKYLYDTHIEIGMNYKKIGYNIVYDNNGLGISIDYALINHSIFRFRPSFTISNLNTICYDYNYVEYTKNFICFDYALNFDLGYKYLYFNFALWNKQYFNEFHDIYGGIDASPFFIRAGLNFIYPLSYLVRK